MSTSFRKSTYIDFDSGSVLVAPMDLASNTPEPWSLPDKMKIFECRVDVWQLGVAVAMLKNIEGSKQPSIWSHAAYGLIAVAFSYFEMLGKTLNPQSGVSGTAGKDFNYGFCDVYPSFKPSDGNYADARVPEVVQFRNRVRNGMYHLAYTKNDLMIHNNAALSGDDFGVRNGAAPIYLLNPHKMVRTIVEHFPTFTARLRDASNTLVQNQFKKFFDDFHSA